MPSSWGGSDTEAEDQQQRCSNSDTNTSLTQLDLSNNKIHELPRTFYLHLPGLTSLNIENNEMTMIPPTLALMPKLKVV